MQSRSLKVREKGCRHKERQHKQQQEQQGRHRRHGIKKVAKILNFISSRLRDPKIGNFEREFGGKNVVSFKARPPTRDKSRLREKSPIFA